MVQSTMVPIMLPLAGKHWTCEHSLEGRKDHRGGADSKPNEPKPHPEPLRQAATIAARAVALRLRGTQVVRSACRDHLSEQE
jgi:hypothetical protein